MDKEQSASLEQVDSASLCPPNAAGQTCFQASKGNFFSFLHFLPCASFFVRIFP